MTTRGTINPNSNSSPSFFLLYVTHVASFSSLRTTFNIGSSSMGVTYGPKLELMFLFFLWLMLQDSPRQAIFDIENSPTRGIDGPKLELWSFFLFSMTHVASLPPTKVLSMLKVPRQGGVMDLISSLSPKLNPSLSLGPFFFYHSCCITFFHWTILSTKSTMVGEQWTRAQAWVPFIYIYLWLIWHHSPPSA